MRIGHGYDLHALADGRRLVLGGVDIPHGRGPVAHSDGDVLLHACWAPSRWATSASIFRTPTPPLRVPTVGIC